MIKVLLGVSLAIILAGVIYISKIDCDCPTPPPFEPPVISAKKFIGFEVPVLLNVQCNKPNPSDGNEGLDYDKCDIVSFEQVNIEDMNTDVPPYEGRLFNQKYGFKWYEKIQFWADLSEKTIKFIDSSNTLIYTFDEIKYDRVLVPSFQLPYIVDRGRGDDENHLLELSTGRMKFTSPEIKKYFDSNHVEIRGEIEENFKSIITQALIKAGKTGVNIKITWE